HGDDGRRRVVSSEQFVYAVGITLQCHLYSISRHVPQGTSNEQKGPRCDVRTARSRNLTEAMIGPLASLPQQGEPSRLWRGQRGGLQRAMRAGGLGWGAQVPRL